MTTEDIPSAEELMRLRSAASRASGAARAHAEAEGLKARLREAEEQIRELEFKLQKMVGACLVNALECTTEDSAP